jgi:hypothetical protein
VIGLTRATHNLVRTTRLAQKSRGREQRLRDMVSAVLGTAPMSQASPDGQSVPATLAGLDQDLHSSSFVQNFKDCRFPMLALGMN